MFIFTFLSKGLDVLYITAVIVGTFYGLFRRALQGSMVARYMYLKKLLWYIVGLLSVVITIVFLKNLLHVPRPFDTLLLGEQYPLLDPATSLPSMHAGIVGYIVSYIVGRDLYNWYCRSVIVFLGLLIVISRVAVGVHTVIDVVLGSLLGIGVALLFWSLSEA